MNSQSEPKTIATTQSIVFEPTSGGGGSFWNGDSLLATLTVLKRADRQGRLSLRDTNRALDLLRIMRKQRTSYQLIENLGLVGDAEWVVGEPSARLRYRGQEFIVAQESLLNAQTHEPLITLALSSDWNDKQMELHVADKADLPLVGFCLFIAYDLVNRPERNPS